MADIDVDDGGQWVYAADILAKQRIGARCLHKWIAAGRFPPPDLNNNGRRVWLRRTILAWNAQRASKPYEATRHPPGAGAHRKQKISSGAA